MGCREARIDDAKKRKKWFGKKPGRIVYESDRVEEITNVQVKEINDSLADIFGKGYFDPTSFEEYLSKFLVEKLGRTDLDLKKNPITKKEAFEIIADLKVLQANLKSKNGLEIVLRKKLLTPSKVLNLDDDSKYFYDSYQNEMERHIKRKITTWNKILDGDGSAKIPIYKKNKDGKLVEDENGRFIKIAERTSLSISKLFNLDRKIKVGLKKTTEREILNEWTKLAFEAAPTRVDGVLEESTRDADAVKRLEEFEERFEPTIRKALWIRNFLEGETPRLNERELRNWGISPGNAKLAWIAYRGMMDDILAFEMETFDKWYDGKTRDGTKYSVLLENEMAQQLFDVFDRHPDFVKQFMKDETERLKQNARERKEEVSDDPFADRAEESGMDIEDFAKEELVRRILNMFKLKRPSQKDNYFPHIRVEQRVYTMSNFARLLNDIETGRINAQLLLSLAKGNQHWLERKVEDGDIVEDTITSTESRILSAIQTRKNLSLRALTIETVKALQKRIQELNDLPDEVYDAKDAQKLVNSLGVLQDYIRLLSSDAQGVPRPVSLITKKALGMFMKPGEIDEMVAQISRIYRAFRIATYLGYSVKSAMKNVSQSIGPVASEFGYKYMLGAQKLVKTSSGAIRTVVEADGSSHEVDIIDQVGIKYDDILSQAERGIPAFEESQFALTKKEQNKLKKWLDKIEAYGQKLAQHSLEHSIFGSYVSFVGAEFRNRAITAIAAYDKKIADLKASGTTGIRAHNTAIAYAREAIDKLQFEYSVFNRPEFLRGPIGASIFLFKSFAVNQTQLQFDWVVDSKRSVIKNSEGVEIDWNRFMKLPRAALQTIFYYALKKKFYIAIGLFAIDAPILEYLNNLYQWIFADDDDEADKAFFGTGGVGAVTTVASGPISDAAILYMMLAEDEALNKKGEKYLFQAVFPGGRTVGKYVGRPTSEGFKPGYFLDWDAKNFWQAGSMEMMVELTGGNIVYPEPED